MTDLAPTDPLFERLAREAVGLARVAAEAAVAQQLQLVMPRYQMGTVETVDTSAWIHRVLMDGDSDPISVHDGTANGAFVGARVLVLFAPPHGAMIIAVNRTQTGYLPWTLAWTTAGGAPSLGNGTWSGQAKRNGQDCDVTGQLTFGSTTSGGTLGFFVGLPYPAASDVGEQRLDFKAFTTGGGNWDGFAYISPGAQVAVPHLPFNSGVSFEGQVQNADGGGGAGTGIPLIAGQYTFTTGTNFVINGNYKTLP